MRNFSAKNSKSKAIINDVDITEDVLTSGAGLTLFVRYLRGIAVLPYMEKLFGRIRKSRKGQEISEIFKQLFCFFIDGTSRHLVYFDTLKALKDFRNEELPFKRFHQNAAFYYTMLIGFFLYETFKKDVCTPIVAVSSYATTMRRKILDVAGKIVHHAGKITLKITISTWQNLDFYQLWIRSGNPIRFVET
jgi:hypothetical protein